MEPYQYRALLPGPSSTRILVLLPSEDEKAAIQCDLVDYRLRESGRPNQRYEALSYTWGDASNPRTILLGDSSLEITSNLHAALLQLRDPDFSRHLWVDAVCINQSDNAEKERQIQFMAQIYGRASQVLVWLGAAAENSDEALETIRSAGMDATTSSDNTSKPIETLLERPWFRRVWILQEVAAARRILVLCGDVEVDGYAFCKGLEHLLNDITGQRKKRPSVSLVTASQSLTQLPTVVVLMRGAIFRPKFILPASHSETKSLGLLGLGELLDLYHGHYASISHDKIYALLGMCTDDLNQSGLLPNYNLSWDQLLRKVVLFIFGTELTSTIVGPSGSIEIQCRGRFMGKVCTAPSVVDGVASFDVRLRDQETWRIRATATSIMEDDLVYQVRGASQPTIVRVHKHHLSIVVMVVAFIDPPIRPRSMPTIQLSQFSLAEANRGELRMLSLFWYLNGSMQHFENRSWSKSKTSARLWNHGLLLQEAHHRHARQTITDAVSIYQPHEGAKGTDNIVIYEDILIDLVITQDVALLHQMFKRMGHLIPVTETVLVTITKTIPKSTDSDYRRADDNRNKLKCLIKHYKVNCLPENFLIEILRKHDVPLLLWVIEELGSYVDITDHLLVEAFELQPTGDLRCLRPLLRCYSNRAKSGDIGTFRIPLADIIRKGDKSTLQCMLCQRESMLHITEDVLEAAYYNDDHDEFMQMLLGRFQKENTIWERIPAKVKDKWGSHSTELLSRIIDNDFRATEAALIRAADKDSASLFLLLYCCQKPGVGITEPVLMAAVHALYHRVWGLINDLNITIPKRFQDIVDWKRGQNINSHFGY